MGYLEGVGRVSEGVLRLSGGCLDVVGGCLRPPEYCQGVLMSTKMKKFKQCHIIQPRPFLPVALKGLKC